jgi:hypothetical protein
MENRGMGLFIAVLLLTGAAAVILMVEERATQASLAQAQAFQHLVGGIGFGPAVDLSGCAFSLDPRLDGTCDVDRGPIPGGGCFCPRHGASVFFYPPLLPKGPWRLD